MDSLWPDVRYGLRVMLKAPGLTAVVVLTLALGIGANTALFSLADAFLWSLLPVRDPAQLVFVRAVLPNGRTAGDFPYPTFAQFRDFNHSLSGLFAYDESHVSATVDGQPDYVDADFVSGSYFDVLGVSATRGRVFTPDDDRVGKPAVAVISDRYWERRFAREPAAVGRTIYLGKIPFTVIGISPPGFFGRNVAGKSADLILPMFMQPRLALRDHDTFGIMARLKPGVSSEQAGADLDVIYRRVLMEAAGDRVSPQTEREIRGRTIQLRPGLRGTANSDNDLPTQLPILLAVVGIVLLIACVNVANLLLSRAAARQREIAVRLSVGATRARLMRQLLTESILLALFGGALGVLLAEWGVGVLTAVLSYGESPIVFDLRPAPRVLAFTGGLSLLAGTLFGVAPALAATRVDLTPLFRGSAGYLSSGPSRRPFARSLVVSQVALSLALLIGAGLLIRSLRQLYAVDPGFEREKVLVMWVLPALNGYDRAGELTLYRELLDKMNAIAGVRSASLSRYRIVTGRPYRDVRLPGSVPPPKEQSRVYCGVVGPRFFETMGIAVVQGREFSASDGEVPKVAVISETMARTFFPGENPIGRRLGLDGLSPEIEVVGIVRDVRHHLGEREAREAIYIPFTQAPPDSLGQMNLVVRAGVSPTSIASAIRREVRSVDADLPLVGVETQAEEVDRYLGGRRSLATLLSFFGTLALVMAAIGLYGTMSHAVGRRTREIGIRMALGAQRTDMLWLVLGEAMSQVMAGVAVGLIIALAAARLIASTLFGVKATDPLTFSAAILVMTVTAVAASYLPARRATRVDPMVSLRSE